MLSRRLLCVAAGALWPAAFLQARSLAAIIGIPDFLQDPGTARVKFANHDAALFQRKIASNFVVFPVGPGQGMFTAQSAVNQALLQARAGDTVFIFLSTRGIARPGATDGYIGVSDFVSQKKESTAVRISYLEKLMGLTKADRIIIFADLCREPAQPVSDNRINIRIAEISGKVSKPVAGILATGPRQFSKEDRNLKSDGQEGFGVFGYYLADSGGRPGAIDLAKLFGNLLNAIPSDRQRDQRPRRFGSDVAGANPLWSIASAFTPSVRRPAFFRFGALHASATWNPFLAEWYEQAADAAVAALEQQLNEPQSIRNPREFAESVRGLEGRMNSNAWEQYRTRAMSVLADAGQACVSRYGIQDLLPKDPLRVSEAEFARCAAALAGAALLLPSEPGWDPYRKMLRVRELFCRARSNPAGSLDLLGQAGDMGEFSIPEVDDALGIYWLQSPQADRYVRAESFFKSAKKASPDWLYPRHNLALLYSEQGDMRSAEREYREALALSTVQPYVYYNYGLILERLNRLGDARREYQKAIAAYDSAIRLLVTRSAEWSKDYPEQSDLALRRAAIFQSAKAEVYNAWGSLLEAKRDMSGAREKYESAHSLDSTLCPPAYNLARMNLVLASKPAEVENVAAELRQRQAVCSAFTPAHMLLANVYRRQAKFEDARTEFQEAIRQMPSSVPALLGLAAIADLQGHFDAAVDWLDKAISTLGAGSGPFSGGVEKGYIAPSNPALYKSLAERYRNAGEPGACRQTYELAAGAAEGKAARRQLESIARICRSGGARK